MKLPPFGTPPSEFPLPSVGARNGYFLEQHIGIKIQAAGPTRESSIALSMSKLRSYLFLPGHEFCTIFCATDASFAKLAAVKTLVSELAISLS